MLFLRNCWYGAAFSSEVTSRPFRRTFLCEHVVLFRTDNGEAVALEDRCAHRFVPLSKGKVRGETLECGYHGLRYDRSGQCVHNPHGAGSIPTRTRVAAYPTSERSGFIWIWMGEEGMADAGLIPQLPAFDSGSGYVAVSGYLHENANYELLTDNLLDLSHAEFLHPAFAKPAGPQTVRTELLRDGDTVYANRRTPATQPTAFLRSLWTSTADVGDGRANISWAAPGVCVLDVGIVDVGGRVEDGICAPSLHIVTPETELSSHYFWTMARNCRLEDTEFSERMRVGAAAIFETEDKPMIEAQQAAMGGSADLVAERPIFLEGDAPATLARGILRAKIEAERGT